MGRVREFYIPTGAASNFLAGKCLWAEDFAQSQAGTHHEERENEVNEHFIQRSRLKITEHIQRAARQGYVVPTAFRNDINIVNEWTGHPHEYQRHLVKETEDILPDLVHLDKHIDLTKNTHPLVWFSEPNSKIRKAIIADPYDFWREPSTFKYQSFLGECYTTAKPSTITRVQEYFTVCRELYFKYCIAQGWYSDIINHEHPKRMMPNIKFPDKSKTLALKTAELSTYCTALSMIKSGTLDRARLLSAVDKVAEDNVTFSDDVVDYRKVFFENDRDEIRKMYEFFGNEEYFDNGDTVIISQFKQYNDKNVDIIMAHDLGILIDG